jgi:serine/threonine protein kinase
MAPPGLPRLRAMAPPGLPRLREGTFSTVRQGVWTDPAARTTVECAYKIARDTPPGWPARVAREIDIMRSLPRHGGVTLFLAAVYGPGSDVTLCYEYCRGEQLGTYVSVHGPFETENRLPQLIGLPLFNALAFLHDHGVLHRGIHPEHVLYTEPAAGSDPKLRLCGYGLVCRDGDTSEVRKRCGIPGYCAPEVLLGSHPHSRASDVFGAGAVCYLAAVGEEAFVRRSLRATLRQNIRAIPLKPFPAGNSRMDISVLLSRRNGDRPSASKLCGQIATLV